MRTLRLQRETLRQFIASHAGVAVQTIDGLSERLADAYDVVEDLSLRRVPGRLARILVQLSVPAEDAVVRATHEDLAQMIGATREEVSRTLSAFRQQGLIRYGKFGRAIQVAERG